MDVAATVGTQTAIWDGTDEAGRTVAPGVYLARATLAGVKLDRKVVRIP